MTESENLSTNYSDEDLTFFALVYQDYDATAACLKDLRKHYPSSRVILRSDGDEAPRFPLLASGHRVDFHGELRLFGIENGGAVIERMLELFLERPTRYLFKIDPDTVIHRRFKYLPVRSGVFGTLQCEEQTPAIQGGCMGFTRDAAEKILRSGMLRDSRLKEPAGFINDSPYFVRMTDRANRCGLASFDWIVAWIACELGIPVYAFDEVNSGWQQPPPSPEGRYAVSHPRGSSNRESRDPPSTPGPEVTGETKRGAVAVLEWRAWNGFLLSHVLGENAVRIETDPFGKFPSAQFDRICESCSTVCFQINLSVRSQLPLSIGELTDRFRKRGFYVVNGVVQDIRKSTLHAHLEGIGLPSLKASPGGAANEILFVKTDLNYGGELERWLPPENIAASGVEHLISPEVGPYHYQTVERRMLQQDLWTNPAIVIEKYITNSEESFYRVYFSGKQIVIVKAFARGIIKKLSGDPRDTNYVTDLDHLKAGTDNLEINASLKRDVATFVENTPIEFGAIDIVHDGRDHHYIIDLNLTPYAGTRPHDPFLTNFLRMGITDPTRRKTKIFLDSPMAGFTGARQPFGSLHHD